MATAKQNVNDMIFKTLKTKADKPAKYVEQLRELGYEVENSWLNSAGNTYKRDYWSVNGLEVDKYEGETAQLALGRGQYVNRFDHIKRIDFVDYFAKLDERIAKAERMYAHDEIEQRHAYRVETFTKWVPANGRRYGKRVKLNRHIHNIVDVNHVVNEYKMMKRKADASGWGWYENKKDYEIEFAKSMLSDAEKRVEKLWKELEEAEKEVERRKQRVREEIDRKAQGIDELDAWLKARGIRKEVA